MMHPDGRCNSDAPPGTFSVFPLRHGFLACGIARPRDQKTNGRSEVTAREAKGRPALPHASF